MTTLITQTQYSQSKAVSNCGMIKYKENPLKGFVKKDHEGTVKRAALAGSAITTAVYLLGMAKFDKKNAFKIKDMFKVNFDNMYRAMGLATSAVIGGLAGGLLTDKKENRKAKVKESIHQFLGNIVTPITIVGIATDKIKKKNFSNIKGICLSGLAAVAGVITGVTGGNYVASKVNQVVFKENDDRKLGIKDFGIHVDDLLVVAALSPGTEMLKGFISKALPAIFLICGYEAGTKTENDVKKGLLPETKQAKQPAKA